MKASGAASSRRVNTGQSNPNASASTPAMMPAVQWRCFWPEAVMIALTGPVRQVETPPTIALAIAPTPQATVIALIGGEYDCTP